jgi:hypothetical protein
MTEFELNQLLDKVCSEIGEVFCNEDFFGSPFVHFLALCGSIISRPLKTDLVI